MKCLNENDLNPVYRGSATTRTTIYISDSTTVTVSILSHKQYFLLPSPVPHHYLSEVVST